MNESASTRTAATMPISTQNVAAACDSDPSLNWLYASSGTVWLLGEASRIGMSSSKVGSSPR